MADVVHFFAYNELINEDYFKEKGLVYLSKSSVTLSAWQRFLTRSLLITQELKDWEWPTSNPPTIMPG